MDYIFNDGKPHYYADHAQFTEIIRELVGDDAADYVGGMLPPDEVAALYDELEDARFESGSAAECERIADEYLDCIQNGSGLVTKLYWLVHDSEMAHDVKYSGAVEKILEMLEELDEVLAY